MARGPSGNFAGARRVKFPYKKILKQAWHITWNNKFLWVLGLFLSGSLSYMVDDFMPNFRIGNNWLTQSSVEEFIRQLPERPGILAAAVSIILLLGAVLIFLEALARACVILAVDKLSDPEKAPRDMGFRAFTKAGYRFVWRLIGISLSVNMILIFVTALLAVPVYYLFSAGLAGKALLLSVIALIIFIPLVVLSWLLIILASNFSVLTNLNIPRSLAAGLDLFTRHWFPAVSLGSLVILVNLSFLSFLSVALKYFFLLVRILGVAMAGYFSISLITSVYFTVFVLSMIFGLIFLAVTSIWEASVWTLAWKEFVKTEKSEDEGKEKVPVPEMI